MPQEFSHENLIFIPENISGIMYTPCSQFVNLDHVINKVDVFYRQLSNSQKIRLYSLSFEDKEVFDIGPVLKLGKTEHFLN